VPPADPSSDAPDRGLARERTELAWNRSGLAVLAVVAILLRRLWPLNGYRSVAALAFIAGGATLWASALYLSRRARSDTTGQGTLAVPVARLLTLGTMVLAACGFVLGAFFPPT
jgi:uncharacterized membrane protein YidH (DUF202 family)